MGFMKVVKKLKVFYKQNSANKLESNVEVNKYQDQQAFKEMEFEINSDVTGSVAKPFQCTIFPENFFHESSLEEHIVNKHVEDKKFQCTKCFETNQLVKSFALRRNLVQHIKRVHGPPSYKCQVCFKSFNDSSNFSSHKRIHSQTNIEKCALCPKSFLSNKGLQTHLFKTHKQKREDVKYFKCEICSLEFKIRSALERHVIHQHVVDKDFECRVCLNTFIDQQTLLKHMKGHDLKFFCAVCSQGFTQKNRLIYHLGVKHNHFWYCGKCKKSFRNKPDFDEHLTASKQELKCCICQELMTSECNLNIHTDSHVKQIKAETKRNEINKQIKPLETDTRFTPKSITEELNSEIFECEICAKTFDREVYIKSHRKIVHPFAEWKCNFEGCSKTFNKHSYLKLHKMVHGETKEYVCNICAKSFYRPASLKQHTRMHLKAKKYKCDICPKSFKIPSSLKSHTANRHGGLKPFKCPIVNCGKLWANNSQLNCHLDTHQTEKSFTCEICLPFRAFKTFKQLGKHQRGVHSVRKTIKAVASRENLQNKKFSDDAVIFICSSNDCFFKTEDEKDVALHYNEQHRLPKVLILKSCSSLSLS